MCWNYLKREKNSIEFLEEIQKENMCWNYLKREEREKQKTEYSIYMFLENCRKKLY